jgi:kynureninase
MDDSPARAEALDAADPLAAFRERFVIDDPELVYLDGNSLGRLPRATADRLARLIREGWGGELIRGWEHWLDLPTTVGDLIGTTLLGARPGEVVVADSTTVDFYRLVSAALDARPGRRVIVTDRANFPTDRYVLERIRAKGVALTGYAIELHDAWLAPLGCTLGSPRDAARRGAHVSIRHPEAKRLCRELVAAGVVPDFREPDRIRLGLAPLYTRFRDVRAGISRLRSLLS